MNCSRCNGKMSFELFEDIQDDTGSLFFYGWRCVHCGEIIDPMIASHRKQRPEPIVSKSRKRHVKILQ